MNPRIVAAIAALAVATTGIAWWALTPVPPALVGDRTMAKDRSAAPTKLPREPTVLHDLAKLPAGVRPPSRLRAPPPERPSDLASSGDGDEPRPEQEAAETSRLDAVLERARSSIWAEGERLGLPESDIQATSARVEAYLRDMDRIRNEVRSGVLDRRDAKDDLSDARHQLHTDLDALVGAETHEALRRAIPAKY